MASHGMTWMTGFFYLGAVAIEIGVGLGACVRLLDASRFRGVSVAMFQLFLLDSTPVEQAARFTSASTWKETV
jgi:hypothetical protein